MKRILALFCCVIGICFLSGCGDVEKDALTMNNENRLYEIVPASDKTGDTVTVKITRPDLTIHTGPGYDFENIGPLLDIGTYTITEQFVCDEGITWGKLKSGLGWIDLDKAAAAAPHIPITMERIDKDTLNTMEYHLYLRDNTDYTQYLLIQPYEPLTDVKISFMDFTDEGFQPGETLYTLEEMAEDKPLVLGVVFYGDFTTFGLFFNDAEGNACQYMIYTSGRNGSVVLQRKDA